MPLDIAVRGLIDAVKAAGMPTIGSVSAQEMRAFQKAMLDKMPPGPDIFRTEDLVIPSDAGGMAARLYCPSAAPRALIVYFHGGGWTVGSLDGWDSALRRLANTSGCAVLSVDYRLAPEAPFPAAVDDALTAVKWAGMNITKLVGEDVPLFVAGDSAGGNLSAVTAQTIRDHGGPRIAAQILIYPSTDGDIDSERLSRFESPFLTREETSWFFDQYIPDRAKRIDVRFAPLRAENLGNLPAAFVLSAENDILSTEAELYAERMREAGVQVKLERYLGTIHGFLTIDRGMLPHSAKAFADIDAFISSVLQS
jgi:acetyl esterase